MWQVRQVAAAATSLGQLTLKASVCAGVYVCVRASVGHLSLLTAENCAALASHVQYDGTRLD